MGEKCEFFRTIVSTSRATNRVGYDGKRGHFDEFEHEDTRGDAARSIEGWVIIVTNIHEEAQEDDIHDLFSDYGEIKNMHLNLDRRTGFVKGYALIEYDKQGEAAEAIRDMNKQLVLDQKIYVGWAFRKNPKSSKK